MAPGQPKSPEGRVLYPPSLTLIAKAISARRNRVADGPSRRLLFRNPPRALGLRKWLTAFSVEYRTVPLMNLHPFPGAGSSAPLCHPAPWLDDTDFHARAREAKASPGRRWMRAYHFLAKRRLPAEPNPVAAPILLQENAPARLSAGTSMERKAPARPFGRRELCGRQEAQLPLIPIQYSKRPFRTR
jgi:hypothetical protein